MRAAWIVDLNPRLALLTTEVLKATNTGAEASYLHVGIAKAHEQRLPPRRMVAMGQNMNPPNQGNQNSPSQGNQGGNTNPQNKPGQGTVKDTSQTGNKK